MRLVLFFSGFDPENEVIDFRVRPAFCAKSQDEAGAFLHVHSVCLLPFRLILLYHRCTSMSTEKGRKYKASKMFAYCRLPRGYAIITANILSEEAAI